MDYQLRHRPCLSFLMQFQCAFTIHKDLRWHNRWTSQCMTLSKHVSHQRGHEGIHLYDSKSPQRVLRLCYMHPRRKRVRQRTDLSKLRREAGWAHYCAFENSGKTKGKPLDGDNPLTKKKCFAVPYPEYATLCVRCSSSAPPRQHQYGRFKQIVQPFFFCIPVIH